MKIQVTVLELKGFTEMIYPAENIALPGLEYMEYEMSYDKYSENTGYQVKYDEMKVSYKLAGKEQLDDLTDVYYDRKIKVGDKLLMKRKGNTLVF